MALLEPPIISEMRARNLRFRHCSEVASVSLSQIEKRPVNIISDPFVITELKVNSLERTQLTHEWMRERFGDIRVHVAVGPRLNKLFEVMEFRKALDIMLSKSAETGQVIYLRQLPVPGPFPGMEEVINVPSVCPSDRAILMNLWIGPEGTIQPFHKDNHHPLAQIDGLLVQLVGEKEVLLVSSRYDNMMSPRSSEVVDYHYSSVDLFGDNSGANALLDQVEASFAVIKTDQGIRIPANTWHHVRALTPSISVSYWWHKNYVADTVFRLANDELKNPHRLLGQMEFFPITSEQLDEYGGLPALQSISRRLGEGAAVKLRSLLPKKISALLN